MVYKSLVPNESVNKTVEILGCPIETLSFLAFDVLNPAVFLVVDRAASGAERSEIYNSWHQALRVGTEMFAAVQVEPAVI